jgi:DNA/RNA-binding domain of Phe-tRNA-synthetase-like protein
LISTTNLAFFTEAARENDILEKQIHMLRQNVSSSREREFLWTNMSVSFYRSYFWKIDVLPAKRQIDLLRRNCSPLGN